MSRLSKLIAELCPKGVEYKKIKEVFKRLRGTPITASQMKQIKNDDGDITIYAGGKTVVQAKEADIEKANIIRVPAVLVQSRGIIDFIYCDRPFTFKNEMWAYTVNEPITVKYLYYVLQNNAKTFREAASGMGALPQISLRVTEDFEIPLPPLEIQSEIVKILDNFAELTAELTAELEKRKKQYEHYRNMLLGGVESGGSPSVEWKRLGEICEMITGFPFKASLFKDSGLAICKTTNIKNGMVSVDTVDFFDPADYNDDFKRYEIKKFDIVIGMSGSIKVGMNRGDQVLYLNQRVGKFLPDESKVLNGYLYYVLINSVELLANNIGGGSVKNLSNRDVLDFSIPLPPLAEQERIVAILDRFDSLCNSLTEGLPAEIALRKKQYEYYRDKLLDFEKAS